MTEEPRCFSPVAAGFSNYNGEYRLPLVLSIESVMLSSHLILCRPLLLLPPTPPSIRVFSNESTLRMRWPKYWSFSFIPSSRGLTTWVSLEWDPEIRVAPVEENSVLDTSLNEVFFCPALTQVQSPALPRNSNG